MRNASPRLSSSSSVEEKEKDEEDEKEMAFHSAGVKTPTVVSTFDQYTVPSRTVAKTAAVGKRRNNSHSLSMAWILMQFLAPVASMVAILQLLHYIRRISHDNGRPMDSNNNNSNNSPDDNSIHTINSNNNNNSNGRIHIDMAKENLDPALQGLRLADCMYFWAPSAIANAGWGVFTAIDMKRGAITQSMPDLCFDYNDDDDLDQQVIVKTANAVRLESFIWSRDVLFPASYVTTAASSSAPTTTSGRRVICQGMASLVNSMPDDERRTATSKVIPAVVAAATRAKPSKNTRLARSIVRDENHDDDDDAKSSTSDGAWLFQANHKIPAGAELTIEYYKQDSTTPSRTTTRWIHLQEKFYDETLNITVDDAPMHPPEWLRQHGKCLDHVEIIKTPTSQSSTNSSSSSRMERRRRRRGAFATRNLVKGSSVLPAPLLALDNRKSLRNINNNSNGISPGLPLWVNYCFQLGRDSSVLFFPFTPGIGAISHHSQNPNVALQWSKDADHDDDAARLTNNVTPGTVIYNLEVYALSNIRKGDELVMDYGSEWETAYQEYKKSTKRSKDATNRPVFRHSIMLPESLLLSSTSLKASTADNTGSNLSS